MLKARLMWPYGLLQTFIQSAEVMNLPSKVSFQGY